MMLKAVVFDSGWGGEIVADYIEEEVPVIEVIRVIDWRNSPYGGRGEEEICELAEAALKPYIGKVDAIVLASNLVTLVAGEYLRRRYPGQKFIGYGRDMVEMMRRMKINHAVLLTTRALQRLGIYRKMIGELGAAGTKIIELPCDDWVSQVDEGSVTERAVERRMKPKIEQEPQVVVMCSTHLMDLTRMIENVFDWRALVIDFKRQVVRDLCRALRLRGGDGRR